MKNRMQGIPLSATMLVLSLRYLKRDQVNQCRALNDNPEEPVRLEVREYLETLLQYCPSLPWFCKWPDPDVCALIFCFF